jgi:hypothetical protein
MGIPGIMLVMRKSLRIPIKFNQSGTNTTKPEITHVVFINDPNIITPQAVRVVRVMFVICKFRAPDLWRITN